MALKKSELYASLWSSCDELRGGMDASQYKDYVLVLLFVKYVSDKYAGHPYAPIIIPPGASFRDMVALKGRPDIGDQINKKILAPLAEVNRLSDMPDFNDPAKLGSGKEMVERLTNLIAIFENKALDFSRNRSEGDDIIGDAYEYLMRHFAVDSGKSKGQFLTPAEASRVVAKVTGIGQAITSADTTVHDPTCGSASLLLKVADEARTPVTLYGQEKDAATTVLARMNMILHDNPTALIVQGNTLTDPKFKDATAPVSSASTTSSPISPSATNAGLPASIPTMTPSSASSPSASPRPSRAITPTCSTSSAPSRAPALPPSSCPTASSFGATPRPRSAATWCAVATSRASSGCRPTSSMAPASPPPSWSSTSARPRAASPSS
jgi:type I restriction enzyme M protein